MVQRGQRKEGHGKTKVRTRIKAPIDRWLGHSPAQKLPIIKLCLIIKVQTPWPGLQNLTAPGLCQALLWQMLLEHMDAHLFPILFAFDAPAFSTLSSRTSAAENPPPHFIAQLFLEVPQHRLIITTQDLYLLGKTVPETACTASHSVASPPCCSLHPGQKMRIVEP